MYCKKCGNEIKDNEKFCSNCGAERPSMEAEEQKPLDKNDISQESVEEKTADAEKSVQEHAATGDRKSVV